MWITWCHVGGCEVVGSSEEVLVLVLNRGETSLTFADVNNATCQLANTDYMFISFDVKDCELTAFPTCGAEHKPMTGK